MGVAAVGAAAAGMCNGRGERGAGQEAREGVNIIPEKEVKQLPAHVPQREGCPYLVVWLVSPYISPISVVDLGDVAYLGGPELSVGR